MRVELVEVLAVGRGDDVLPPEAVRGPVVAVLDPGGVLRRAIITPMAVDYAAETVQSGMDVARSGRIEQPVAEVRLGIVRKNLLL